MAEAIDYVLTEDQRLIRDTAKEFLASEAPIERVRDTMMSDTGHDQDLWSQMASLGWTGLMAPEDHGGAGLGMDDLGVLLEELGGALTPGPFFASAVAATMTVLGMGTDEQKASLLPGLADGSVIGTVALWEAANGWRLQDLTTTATRTATGWVVDGSKRSVIYGHVADLLLVVAMGEGDPAVFVVSSETPGVEVNQVEALDPTRRLADVALRGVELDDTARLDGGGSIGVVLHSIVSALANEQLGGAQRCMEMAVEYAKTRYQFGRPIGSYQAIKHRCAEMLVRVEQARSTAYHATRVGTDGAEPAIAAHLAASICSAAYNWIAGENIQVHGGIGFTWEHDAHLYLKRAKSSSLLFGTPAFHRDELGKLIGI